MVRGVVKISSNLDPMSMLSDQLNSGNAGLLVVPEVSIEALNASNPQFIDFNHATVVVDRTQHLETLCGQLSQLRFQCVSALGILEQIDLQIDEAKWVMFGIAAAILFTAAIGISNTLVISVLERTPEFGILKSVGAKDSQLVLLMLCEGAVLGILGAVLAIGLSVAAAVFGESVLEHYVEARMNADLPATLFRFSPAWLAIVVFASTAVCTFASILPAWRAARHDPVVAMRRT
jgi:putative ABC transport system permease protein